MTRDASKNAVSRRSLCLDEFEIGTHQLTHYQNMLQFCCFCFVVERATVWPMGLNEDRLQETGHKSTRQMFFEFLDKKTIHSKLDRSL